MTFEQFVDQTAGLEAIQLAHSHPEQVLGELLHLGFVEATLLNDFFDELALLVTAAPSGRHRGGWARMGLAWDTTGDKAGSGLRLRRQVA